jgi:hypothetical protein
MVLGAALIAFALASAGLLLLNELALSWYYQLAWWSYIVAVDDVNRRLAGRSLLRDEPARFVRLALGSVVWWTLFEALNLRLGNWYYVMVHPERWVNWTAGVVAFATVLPAIDETRALLENMGWLRSWRVRPLRWTARSDAVCVTLGVACFALPLLWPDRFFPLTWASFVFLLEPWNRRHARASFLRDLEAGEAGDVARTLVAGLACGLLWEVWNHWARTKWIYTVPGFEDWKLFEMPILGFLGFPPFALECVVLVRFVDAAWARRPRRPIVGAALTAIAVGFTTWVFFESERVTSDSFYAPVRALSLLPKEERDRLEAAGLGSPERLLRALGTDEGRAAWSRRTGVSADRLESVYETVALVMHRGLGHDRASQLARMGIRTRAELRRWSAEALTRALRQLGSSPRDRFLERRTRIWATQARPRSRA